MPGGGARRQRRLTLARWPGGATGEACDNATACEDAGDDGEVAGEAGEDAGDDGEDTGCASEVAGEASEDAGDAGENNGGASDAAGAAGEDGVVVAETGEDGEDQVTGLPKDYALCMESALLAGLDVHKPPDHAEEFTKKTAAAATIPDSDLAEEFWNFIGIPKDSRWWEQKGFTPEKSTGNVSGDNQLRVTDLGSGQIIDTLSSPSPLIHDVGVTQNRPPGRSVPRRGFVVRPWKGPLPRPKRSPLTLSAFLPPELTKNQTTSSKSSEFLAACNDAEHDDRVSMPPEPETRVSRTIQKLNPVDVCLASQAELIARARMFGRARPVLETNRDLPRARGSTGRWDNSPRAGSGPILQPHDQEINAASRITPISFHGRPSYTDMAGRPPPQQFRNNGPPYHRQDLPARNNPRHYQYEGRGQGPGRGRVDGRAGSDRGRGEDLDGGRAPTHQAREQRYQAVPPRAHQIGPNGHQFGAGASVAESSQQGAVRGKLQQQQQKQTTQAQDAGVAKVKKRPFCWRCKCGGHSNEECQATLDCFICNKKNNHVPLKCPILKKPKPTATFFGSGKTEFGFLRIMDDDYTSEIPEPTPTALVKFSGGTISAEVIQSELARITRVDWKWEAIPHGKDSFLVAFPSEDEMQRMTDIDFRLKSHGGVTLTISEWQNASSIPQSYKLDEVWVHISGVPHAWRHYLVFWALGTVIGATLDVDMLTYRKKGVIRVLVGVLDKTKLPFTTDLVFGKDGYDITYTLEDESFVPAPFIAYGHTPSDRDGKKKEDDGSADKDPENMSKKQKNLTGVSTSLPTSKSSEAGTGPTPMQTKLSSLLVDITKLPPMWLTPFCKKGRRSSGTARAVSGESSPSLHLDTPPQVAGHSPTVGVEKPTQTCSQTTTRGDMTPKCADVAMTVVPPAMLAPACSMPTLDVDLRPNRDTAEVHEAGSIVCIGGPSHVRRKHENLLTQEPSATMQTTPHKLIPADEDSTLKAMRRAAVRNLDGPKGNKKTADDTVSPLSSSIPCNKASGYFLDYTLAPQLGYSPEAFFSGIGYSGVSVFGTGGQGVFYPGTWVAV